MSIKTAIKLKDNFKLTLMAGFMGTLATLPLTFDAQANQFKRIRDINVACNNALSCNIYIANRRVTLNSFGFRRSAAPVAELQIAIGARKPLLSNSDLVFKVDDNLVLTLPVSALNYRAATYEYFYKNPEDLTALLRAARAGNRLEISYTTISGRSTAPFSLSGITAGLIFADEVQGRVGDDDALIALSAEQTAVSSQTTSANESERNIEDWDSLPQDILANYGSENKKCSNELTNADNGPAGGFEVNLNDNTQLIALPCGTPGAYNFPSALWYKTPDQVFPLSLPVISEKGPTTTDLVWNISWDNQKREISSFFKGRGIGDCGTYTRWELAESDGKYHFVLLEQKIKDNCDGIYKEDFSDYDQLWPRK